MKPLSPRQLTKALDALYLKCNRREYVNPDPLHCVYRYTAAADQEIAALVAAGLAYGRVAQIMRNVDAVFDVLGNSPRTFLLERSPAQIERSFDSFQHRWTTGAELAALLIGIRRMLTSHDSLESAFLAHQPRDAESSIPALTGFCDQLRAGSKNSLLPDPAKNAACKRLHLYLRWMVRKDSVDLGCWNRVDPRTLLIPLDTHMHRISKQLGFTKRAQANLATTLEITRAFRGINPGDPTKYDFALTRFGIRAELSAPQLEGELRALLAERSAPQRANAPSA